MARLAVWIVGLFLAFLLAAWGYQWWTSPSTNPLDYYEPKLVPSLVVTVNDGDFPEAVGADEDYLFRIRYAKSELPPGREYVAFMLVHNVGLDAPKNAYVSLLREQEQGQHIASAQFRTKGGTMTMLSPQQRPPNDPEHHWIGNWNTKEFLPALDVKQPVQLDLWFAESEQRHALENRYDPTAKPSVLVWTRTFRYR